MTFTICLGIEEAPNDLAIWCYLEGVPDSEFATRVLTLGRH
jgi:hypothetical protein